MNSVISRVGHRLLARASKFKAAIYQMSLGLVLFGAFGGTAEATSTTGGNLAFVGTLRQIWEDFTGPILAMLAVAGLGFAFLKWAAQDGSGAHVGGIVKWLFVGIVFGGGILTAVTQLGITGAVV